MSDSKVEEETYPIQPANPTGTIIGTLSISDLEKVIIETDNTELRATFLRWLITILGQHEKKLLVSQPLDSRSFEYYRRQLK